MKKDRSYYRALTHNELWEETKYGINVDWHELAIALTERLGTIRHEHRAALPAVLRDMITMLEKEEVSPTGAN